MKSFVLRFFLFSFFSLSLGVRASADSLVKGIYGPSDFKELKGETIILKTNNNYSKLQFFFWETPDTVWIKKVKKPKEGKHYNLQRSQYRKDGYGTPPSVIDGVKFFVKDVDVNLEESISSWNGHYDGKTTITLHLENLSNGDLLYWQLFHKATNYADNGGDNEGVDIILEDLSKQAYNLLDTKEYYIDNKLFQIDRAEYTISTKFYYKPEASGKLYFAGMLDNRTPHRIANDNPGSLETVEAHKQRIERTIRENAYRGHFIIFLSKVKKPANSKIRNGKIVEQEADGKFLYEDNYLNCILGVLEKEVMLILQNKTDYTMKVLWDEAAFISASGTSQRVIHSGVNLRDRAQPQAPSVIPGHSILNDSVTPSDNIRFSSYLGEWLVDPLLDGLKTAGKYSPGTKVSLLLPIQISGVKNEYLFIFELKWEYDHPDLLEEYLKSHKQ